MSSPPKSLRILVAPNAFKESLSAMEAAAAISRGLLKILPTSKITQLPIADGGDGTLEAVVEGTRGKILRARVLDPPGKENIRPIRLERATGRPPSSKCREHPDWRWFHPRNAIPW